MRHISEHIFKDNIETKKLCYHKWTTETKFNLAIDGIECTECGALATLDAFHKNKINGFKGELEK